MRILHVVSVAGERSLPRLHVSRESQGRFSVLMLAVAGLAYLAAKIVRIGKRTT
jgi:hypothetical protein